MIMAFARKLTDHTKIGLNFNLSKLLSISMKQIVLKNKNTLVTW